MVDKRDGRPPTEGTLRRLVPFLHWAPSYDRRWLRVDTIAAVTVWAILVPEAMAYATLAGMPPEAGLYAVPLALLAYAILGTSRHLSVGPSSAVAVMSAVVVAPIVASDPGRFVMLSVVLALLVGVIMLLAGLTRMGVFANIMSEPIITGFIIGLAVTIVVSQVDKLVGFEVPTDDFFEGLWYLATNLHQAHLPTLAVGISCLALMLGLHRFVPRVPAALVTVVFSILLVKALDLASRGVAIIGDVPSGLPPVGIPSGVTVEDIQALLPGAIAIALVGYVESMVASRTYARRYHYELDPNQELVAIGVANLGSGLCSGFVVSGSLSRTAAAEVGGVRTQMASLINAGLVVVTLLVLTPFFHDLPLAALGAIVIYAVWRLINLDKLRNIWSVKRLDFWTAMVAMFGVLTIGIIYGLAFAVLLAVGGLLYRAANPGLTVLGRVPDQGTFRSLDRHPDAVTYPGLCILRLDGPLFFANSPTFRKTALAIARRDPSLKVLLVDAEAINDIDTTAIDMLSDLNRELERDGIDLRFARMHDYVRDFLVKAGLLERIGPLNFYPTVHRAVYSFMEENDEVKPRGLDLE